MQRLLAFLTVLVAVSLSAQVSDKQLVNEAFPPSLDDGDGIRFARFVRADLNGDGQPLLVAVYTNGARGMLRVLDNAGQVLAEPSLRGMSGFHGRVRAIDLDADGMPELIAQFDSGHGLDLYDSWVFKWNKETRQLALISPTCKGGTVEYTCFNSVDFVDWNGDGRLAIINYPDFEIVDGDVEPTGPWTLYSLASGQYQKQSYSFACVGRFSRGTSQPTNASESFDRAVAGAATLRVVNGSKTQATDSGHVLLNGAEVLGPADFKREDHLYSVSVQLHLHNVLTVRLDGKPGARIQVFIDDPQATP